MKFSGYPAKPQALRAGRPDCSNLGGIGLLKVLGRAIALLIGHEQCLPPALTDDPAKPQAFALSEAAARTLRRAPLFTSGHVMARTHPA